MIPEWVEWDDECDACGCSPVEVLTGAGTDDDGRQLAYCGDEVRCDCGATGVIYADSETPAIVEWSDDGNP